MSDMTVTGTVFDIQHFSVSDGPGIRTTVFLKGCPLRCLWCHNPESYSAAPQLFYYTGRCTACGLCAAVCPNGCHHIENGVHHFDRSRCTACGLCAARCPNQALAAAGKTMTVEEVLAEVLEDRFFYESSGGGITLSGGEPLFQPAFSLALAQAAKEAGLHVAIETSGLCQQEQLLNYVNFVDLFLFDYKATGDEMHRAFTGVTQAQILRNLAALDEAGAAIILRCPMVPGYNLNETHSNGIISTAKSLKNLREIHLEPYHNIGISKREGLGITEYTDPITPPTAEELKPIAELIQKETGLLTKIM
ncbi:MAG: glycyl-radical enzyme activating protein [Ruminococcaceae bacterium]|nr:glycyl-radical enzyme activating protein [Oscillospiraceae bacterium]